MSANVMTCLCAHEEAVPVHVGPQLGDAKADVLATARCGLQFPERVVGFDREKKGAARQLSATARHLEGLSEEAAGKR